MSTDKKTYIFILCPPYQGSTLLVNLLDSSNKCSTFVNASSWMGEAQWLLKKNGDVNYESQRWNPNYDINMELMDSLFDKYLDGSKTIFVEKSPPNICRAKKIEEHFSKLGNVIFLISIRSPYSTDHYGASEWIKFANYQKYNIETLKNTIVTSYEELCLNLDTVINKIQEKIPILDDIHNQNNSNKKLGERGKKINTLYLDRIIDKTEKNEVLKQHIELLNYFGYELIE